MALASTSGGKAICAGRKASYYLLCLQSTRAKRLCLNYHWHARCQHTNFTVAVSQQQKQTKQRESSMMANYHQSTYPAHPIKQNIPHPSEPTCMSGPRVGLILQAMHGSNNHKQQQSDADTDLGNSCSAALSAAAFENTPCLPTLKLSNTNSLQSGHVRRKAQRNI